MNAAEAHTWAGLAGGRTGGGADTCVPRDPTAPAHIPVLHTDPPAMPLLGGSGAGVRRKKWCQCLQSAYLVGWSRHSQ